MKKRFQGGMEMHYTRVAAIMAFMCAASISSAGIASEPRYKVDLTYSFADLSENRTNLSAGEFRPSGTISFVLDGCPRYTVCSRTVSSNLAGITSAYNSTVDRSGFGSLAPLWEKSTILDGNGSYYNQSIFSDITYTALPDANYFAVGFSDHWQQNVLRRDIFDGTPVITSGAQAYSTFGNFSSTGAILKPDNDPNTWVFSGDSFGKMNVKESFEETNVRQGSTSLSYNAAYKLTSATVKRLDVQDADPPSRLELAAMSANSYGDANSKPTGNFTLVKRFAEEGDLAASVYQSLGEDGGANQIVVAIRGSKTARDFLVRDADIGVGDVQRLQPEINRLAQKVAAFAGGMENAKITFTGHSLGGAVAEILAGSGDFAATSFNAPGVKGLFDLSTPNAIFKAYSPNLSSSTQGIVSVRAAGDPVSLFGKTFGAQETYDYLDSSVIGQLKPGACFFTCHLMDGLYGAIASGRQSNLVPSYKDLLISVFPNLITGLTEGKSTKFKAPVVSDIEYALDPEFSGDYLELILGDSTARLKTVRLMSLEKGLLGYYFNGTDWFEMGLFDGLVETDVPDALAYRFSGAKSMADEYGHVFIGAKFSNNGVFSGTLRTVSLVNSAVPEPSTWAMMIVGFGFIGISFRRKRRNTMERLLVRCGAVAY